MSLFKRETYNKSHMNRGLKVKTHYKGLNLSKKWNNRMDKNMNAKIDLNKKVKHDFLQQQKDPIISQLENQGA